MLFTSDPIHKTNILPLRWFANFCNFIGTPHLIRMFYMQEELNITSGARWKFHGFVWKWTNKIYNKWGTYYKLDINKTEEENGTSN